MRFWRNPQPSHLGRSLQPNRLIAGGTAPRLAWAFHPGLEAGRYIRDGSLFRENSAGKLGL